MKIPKLGVSYVDLCKCDDPAATVALLSERGEVVVHVDNPANKAEQIKIDQSLEGLDVGVFYGTERACKEVACDQWLEAKDLP